MSASLTCVPEAKLQSHDLVVESDIMKTYR